VARILKRDMYMCRKCGARASEVDHVIPKVMGGSDDDYNLQSLCGPCHAVKSAGQATPRRTGRRRRRGGR